MYQLCQRGGRWGLNNVLLVETTMQNSVHFQKIRYDVRFNSPINIFRKSMQLLIGLKIIPEDLFI